MTVAMIFKRQPCRHLAVATTLLLITGGVRPARSSVLRQEMAVANISRSDPGDSFTLIGSDCGPTRCMEWSHGTALGALRSSPADPCLCHCPLDLPVYREDQHVCVSHIEDCDMAYYGDEMEPSIPSVHLPFEGQIIHPSQDIIFTGEENDGCEASSAQYLSESGWVTIGRRKSDRDDVPFVVFRDQGRTFLKWRGSALTRSRLEGRLVIVHVFCKVPPALTPDTPVCAAFRVQGVTHSSAIDVPSIVFNAGDTATEPSGLSVLESLAIGVCVLLLIFIYAAGIVFYVHYKSRMKMKNRDIENTNTLSTDGSNMDGSMDNVTLKTNPLLKMSGFRTDYHPDTLSDVSERTEEHLDAGDKPGKKPLIISAMVHTRKKSMKKTRDRGSPPCDRQRACSPRAKGLRASPELERAPQSSVAIVDCREQEPGDQESTVVRRKLYFNPVFFEPEHLKNPPPAAIEFLVKIREVMSIAKEKMTSKKFTPSLTKIPEEETYHSIDLGWDIPCGRRGRRFSAVSLKRENSRKSHRCTGCPGCDTSSLRDIRQSNFVRSTSCKSCVSEEFKQKIVRKWLDDVPPPLQPSKPIKSIAMVSGTPRAVEPKKPENKKDEPKISPKIEKKDIVVIGLDSSPPRTMRKVRKKLPPPPPPPVPPPDPPKEAEMPKEVKKKMEAVIQELSEFRRVEPTVIEEVRTEFTKPIEPRLVIPVIAADVYEESPITPVRRMSEVHFEYEIDSLERGALKKRRFSLCNGNIEKKRIPNHDGAVSMDELEPSKAFKDSRLRLSQSCRDVRKALENKNTLNDMMSRNDEPHSLPVNDVFVSPIVSEPVYGNLPRPGALTIQVRGSPIRERRAVKDDFDPDTLDRKPRMRSGENNFDGKKIVDKILLKSANSFKHKANLNDDPIIPTDSGFSRKIGSLRQIYEAKAKMQSQNDTRFFLNRPGNTINVYDNGELSSFARDQKIPDLLKRAEVRVRDPKPPVPPKFQRYTNVTRVSPPESRRRGSPEENRRRGSPEESRRRGSPEEIRRRDSPEDNVRVQSRAEQLHARRSGRKSARFRNRRAEVKKFQRPEDSGYLSTDSNESKRRARFMMHIRARAAAAEASVAQQLQADAPSDTDEAESCDGRSESGAESVETDSVFFGNADSEPERLYTEFGLKAFMAKVMDRDGSEQMDSGFIGETSIIVSGDSDSEHRSVISIVTGNDGRTSVASVGSVTLRDEPYAQSVEC